MIIVDDDQEGPSEQNLAEKFAAYVVLVLNLNLKAYEFWISSWIHWKNPLLSQVVINI